MCLPTTEYGTFSAVCKIGSCYGIGCGIFYEWQFYVPFITLVSILTVTMLVWAFAKRDVKDYCLNIISAMTGIVPLVLTTFGVRPLHNAATWGISVITFSCSGIAFRHKEISEDSSKFFTGISAFSVGAINVIGVWGSIFAIYYNAVAPGPLEKTCTFTKLLTAYSGIVATEYIIFSICLYVREDISIATYFMLDIVDVGSSLVVCTVITVVILEKYCGTPYYVIVNQILSGIFTLAIFCYYVYKIGKKLYKI